jgi:hypothetical protein
MEFQYEENKMNIPIVGDIGYFIVNTNERNFEGSWRTMLNDLSLGRASVHYNAECGIKSIEIGDRVYLLQRYVGIIACGIAISEYQEAYFDECPNAEGFVNLRFVWTLEESQWNYAPKIGEIQRRSGDPQPIIEAFNIIDKNRSEAIESILAENIQLD